MCIFFFTYDELVWLSSYQTLGDGISEYFRAEQSCVILVVYNVI